ncbi:hypothetical protein ACCQ03_14775 [Xanthomonas sp. NCPPB 3569]|uniref:hypothetical protein n=1 Tax=Xanthomonas sp. NCPPB 3569 TaxID=487554 RepID=UPI0035565ED0
MTLVPDRHVDVSRDAVRVSSLAAIRFARGEVGENLGTLAVSQATPLLVAAAAAACCP